MKDVKHRVQDIEKQLAKKSAVEKLDMRIEFCTCDLESQCPMVKHRINGMWASEDLFIIGGKCQHRMVSDDIETAEREGNASE